MSDILDGYAAAATPDLIARYDALSPLQIYESVLDLLPTEAVRVVDIGAGTGRDAAWLAAQGHEVLAIEPVEEFRCAGMALHGDDRIAWLDDRLPELERAQAHGRFGLILLCGVWQHLSEGERAHAMTRIAGLAAAGATLIVSLRHGPGAPGRRVFPAVPATTIEAAHAQGFCLVRRVEKASLQPWNRANGVRWTWLAFAMTAET